MYRWAALLPKASGEGPSYLFQLLGLQEFPGLAAPPSLLCLHLLVGKIGVIIVSTSGDVTIFLLSCVLILFLLTSLQIVLTSSVLFSHIASM